MITCKRCGNPLVTTVASSRCLFCGSKVNAFRAARGAQAFTRKGAFRAAKRKIIAEDHPVADVSFRVSPPTTVKPPTLHGMTWQEAERLACQWMKTHGYRDASLTGPGADGGIDVRSRKAIAQVKHHAKPVGLAEMQRLFGIAQDARKRALFFSAAGFTAKASAWARARGIEMYTYPPVKRLR